MKRRDSVAILLLLGIAGCSTIPNGGYYGDVTEIGTPGPVLGTVNVTEGMLVQTVELGQGTSVNIQVNKDEPSDSDPLLYENVLTIGRFSKVVGSGFSKSRDIYYRKRIHDDGKDIFEVDGRSYMVTWKCTHRNPWSGTGAHERSEPDINVLADRYSITIRELKR